MKYRQMEIVFLVSALLIATGIFWQAHIFASLPDGAQAAVNTGATGFAWNDTKYLT